jgi:mono/diheme cytochrome c family protein
MRSPGTIVVALAVCFPVAAAAEQPGDWLSKAQARRDEVQKVIAENHAGFEAFDTGSLGDATLEMIPFVVFRVLQELEPAVFSDAALASVGFFPRTDTPTRLNGIVWTRPVPLEGGLPLRYMTRTCTSCHMGRVRRDDGTIELLLGGTNTEMNLHLFIGRLTTLFAERLGKSNDPPAYAEFRQRISAALEQKPPQWYWGAESKLVSPEEAAREVAAVRSNLDAVLATIRQMNDRRLAGISLLVRHSYASAKHPPSLTGGAPGLVETSGLGSTGLVSFVGEEKAATVLPAGPSMADIPAVWRIDVNGYANWDATIVGFARSLTSSLAVVGNPTKIDLQTNASIQDFIGKLPAAPYPFTIDDAARLRGETTFKNNCAGCHEPTPGRAREKLVFDVGTDRLRADAISSTTVKMMEKVLRVACPPTQTQFTLADPPLIDPTSQRGYVANALHGTWAQAPYLHNGSVPTLRQLLVPALRTNKPFLRGSIVYNQQDGGWEWAPAREAELRQLGASALALHDITKDSFANTGHGSEGNPLVVDGQGKTVRIAWRNDEKEKPIVDDLIAYLLSL